MSAVTDFAYEAPDKPDIQSYRAVSRSAVVGVTLAAVGLLPLGLAALSFTARYGDAFPTGSLAAVIGCMAIAFGLVGWSAVRRFPEEFTGGKLAVAALVAGLLQLAGGSAMAAHTYLHEVPEGYTRTGFWELQPDPDYPELPVSKKAIDLSGKPIFIKGYMHPGVASMGKVNHFILVPDMGTCCFGGDPKPTDMIEVRIPSEVSGIAYSRSRLKLAGKFAVTPFATQTLGMKNGVWYHLELDERR
jgi:hypothetical protein